MNTKYDTVASRTLNTGGHTGVTGTRLRQVRTYLGESTAEFARRIGLSRGDLIDSECSFCELPAEALAELDRMGISLRWLLNHSPATRA
jgi:transcriptional regulator with XRE-family HTH domain